MKKHALALALAFLASCGDDDESATTPDAAVADAGGADGALASYWDHVAPVFFEKCVSCHQEGGVGPFRLDRYEDAKKWAMPAAMATKEGRMPPFLATHDGTCGEFHASETLTAAEKQRIWDWAHGGQAEGTPRALTLPRRPSLEGGEEIKTPLFAPVAQGGTVAQFDEYRCFFVDTSAQTRYLTGYEVLPGNASIVHHVIVFGVDPQKVTMSGKTNAEVIQALDDADQRIGWPCFGAAGEGVSIDSAPVDWAPGQGVVNYPEKMGVLVKQGYRLVAQVHYNLATPGTSGMTDQTTIRLRYADKVDRRLAFLLPDPFLDSLRNKMPEVLAPGQKSVTYTWKRTGQQLGLGGLPYADVMAFGPHMHERGRKLELRIADNATATPTCKGKVEAWDFAWQRVYFYSQPPRLTPASEVSVTCDYDTSDATSPVLPGWGTRNEMCLSMLMVALPPGI